MINRGIFNRFVLQYVDEHRDELLATYPDFESFQQRYLSRPRANWMHLIAFASQERSWNLSQDQWDISEEQISLLIKGYMARDLWDMTNFYEVYNTSNEVFNKAVEILKNPSMLTRNWPKLSSE